MAAEAQEPLADRYDPRGVEDRWYGVWEARGYFRGDPGQPGRPFAVVIPPPNVTGSLHIGHALNTTLQDVLVRFHRMDGRATLWVPGTDHAGIATQYVVERQLAAEGLTREGLGREAFLERAWAWKEASGGTILRQLKRLGASCDWSRERFTMDAGLSRAVREVFVRLHAEGLVYRDDYIVNWCPRCQTVLSDLEVEREERDTQFVYIRYGPLVLGTVRPETKLGDTGIAVHPDDPRYAAWVGQELEVASVEGTVRMRVVADRAVDPAFGTGVVKVTPGHDPVDFEIGRRHGLPIRTVIGLDGRMTAEAGRYAGLDRFECRTRIVADLASAGLLERVEPYRHAVGVCYRCRTVVEPLISKQWYVAVQTLAVRAATAVREGRTRITPRVWRKTYFNWLSAIRPWCISRQLWWGHRIPAWYCTREGTVHVSHVDLEACPACGGEVVQDPDVLDTWFSSALWPFSTLGWPEATPELARFYPTAVLVTSFDILFFWVARMMMLGLHCLGAVPFRDVYIHALVRDAEGQKMSKSRGNVIDPLGLMEQYGTDALRFTLVALAAQGRDIRLAEERVEGYRNFANKLWNAARLVLGNLDGYDRRAARRAAPGLAERWIRSRLSAATFAVRRALGQYRFNEAASALYQFLWHEFCDWYLEVAKLGLYQSPAGSPERLRVQHTLVEVLEATLRLLHPFMPFITEELWQRLPGAGLRGRRADGRSIVVARFPRATARSRDAEAEQAMGRVLEVVTAVRSIRSELRVPPSAVVEVAVRVEGAEAALLADAAPLVAALARARVVVGPDVPRPAPAVTAVVGPAEVLVGLAGVIDLAAERARLGRELEKTDAAIGFLEGKLGRAEFVGRAPEEVVARERARLDDQRELRARLARTVAGLG